MKDELKRIRVVGLSAKLTRDEWDEIEIAVGAAAGDAGIKAVYLMRDESGKIVGTCASQEDPQ